VHSQDHQNVNYERDENEGAVGENSKDYSGITMATSGNKVKLPEIGYGISHSTEAPDGFSKHNNAMNNFNSDPYALRIK
jgi:hypothetical protein